MCALIMQCGSHMVSARHAVKNFPQMWGEHTTNHSFGAHSTNIDQSILEKNTNNSDNMRTVHEHEKTFLHGTHTALCVCPKSWQILVRSERYTNCLQTVQHVCNPVHAYTHLVCELFMNGLVRKCVLALMKPVFSCCVSVLPQRSRITSLLIMVQLRQFLIFYTQYF